MVFSWLRNQRRMELLSEPFPRGWRTYLHDNVRHYEHLDPRRRTTVEQVVQILVAEKNWDGGARIDVTEEMKVTVAGQAAILVLGLEEPFQHFRQRMAGSRSAEPAIQSTLSSCNPVIPV